MVRWEAALRLTGSVRCALARAAQGGRTDGDGEGPEGHEGEGDARPLDADDVDGRDVRRRDVDARLHLIEVQGEHADADQAAEDAGNLGDTHEDTLLGEWSDADR